MTIALRAFGAAASGTGNIVPALPAGVAVNDFMVLWCQSQAAQAVAAPAGWTPFVGSPVSSTSGRLTAFWRRYVALDAAPTVVDPGDHVIGAIVAFSGVITTGSPIYDVDVSNTGSTTSTAVSFPAVDVLDSYMLVGLCINNTDTTTAQFSSYTFTGIDTSIPMTLGSANTNAGTGGGIGLGYGLATGTATVGATGTQASASQNACLAFSLIPDGVTANEDRVDYTSFNIVAEYSADRELIDYTSWNVVVDRQPKNQDRVGYASLNVVITNEPQNQERVGYASLQMVVNTSPPVPPVMTGGGFVSIIW